MPNSNHRVDILASSGIRKLIRSRCFPYLLQGGALVVFVVLIANGLMTGAPESYGVNLAKTIRKTNITTLLVWGMWWPGLIIATIVLGRIWCTVCPMELVTNVTRRIARAMGVKGIALPRWLRMGFGILLAYLVLQFAVAGFQTHRAPLYTSYMLIGLFVLALVGGGLFREPRAFCKGLCPAALLLDLYGRLSPVAVANRSDDICEKCEAKDCTTEESRFRLDSRSCPSYLRPYDLAPGDPCVVCFQCAKVCPHDNIGFGIVRSGWRAGATRTLPIVAALFVFIASGFVAHELFAETKALDKVFHAVPKWLAGISGMPERFKWFEATWFLFILPATVFTVVWTSHRLSRSRVGAMDFAQRIAFFLIPVIAAGHAIKAAIKINKWCVYLPSALSDTIGIGPAKAIVSGSQPASSPLIPEIAVAVLVAIVLAAALVVASKTIRRRLEAAFRPTAYVGVALLTGLYGIVIAFLFVQ